MQIKRSFILHTFYPSGGKIWLRHKIIYMALERQQRGRNLCSYLICISVNTTDFTGVPNAVNQRNHAGV